MIRRILILGFLALSATVAIAARPWTVILRDGSRHDGSLLRLVQGEYLLQTDDALLELAEDDIDPRTFADRSRRDAEPERHVAVTNHYEELQRDGTVRQYVSFSDRNETDRAITEYRYGLAPWEQREIDQRSLIDCFGNVIPQEFDPPRDQWLSNWDRRVQVTARLPVPIAPGESVSHTIRNVYQTKFRKVDGGYAWAHPGDYSEDRLVWLKVRLPQGARLVRATPEPSATFEEIGFSYVMWRQFYLKGERRNLEVVFTFD